VGDPTRPTRPIGQPQTAAARHEPVHPADDDLLLEEVQRLRFWTYFGAAVAVAASILGVIALVMAINNSSDGDSSRSSTRSQLDGLRTDINTIRADLAATRSSTSDAADEIKSLSPRIKKLEQQAEDASNTADDVSQLQKDLKDLKDRVDQVELAQEEAASGGP
jgi:septal ring factor EnvC (AmiA/AmiB activator)